MLEGEDMNEWRRIRKAMPNLERGMKHFRNRNTWRRTNRRAPRRNNRRYNRRNQRIGKTNRGQKCYCS